MARCEMEFARRIFVHLIACLGLTGCATFPAASHPANSRVEESQSRDQQISKGQTTEEEPVLSAVADFLERTRDMEPHSPTGSKANEPQKPSSAPLPSTPPTKVAENPRPSIQEESREGNVIANTQMALRDGSPASSPLQAPTVRSLTVRAAPPTVRPVELSPSSTTNLPLETAEVKQSSTIEAALAELQNESAATQSIESEWRLRLLQCAAGRESEARTMSEFVPYDSRAIWSAFAELVLAVKRTLVSNQGQPDENVTGVLDNLRTLLADRLGPSVDTVALCRRVVAYGIYEELSSDELQAGRPLQAIVYSEIKNLKAEKTPEGQFRAVLRTRLELLKSDGTVVWERDEPDVVDTCRRRRSDFFVAQRVSFPLNLSAGDYVLKFFVEDRLSLRTAESNLPLTLESSVSLVKSPAGSSP